MRKEIANFIGDSEFLHEFWSTFKTSPSAHRFLWRFHFTHRNHPQTTTRLQRMGRVTNCCEIEFHFPFRSDRPELVSQPVSGPFTDSTFISPRPSLSFGGGGGQIVPNGRATGWEFNWMFSLKRLPSSRYVDTHTINNWKTARGVVRGVSRSIRGGQNSPGINIYIFKRNVGRRQTW